jgi:hypothetical protein
MLDGCRHYADVPLGVAPHTGRCIEGRSVIVSKGQGRRPGGNGGGAYEPEGIAFDYRLYGGVLPRRPGLLRDCETHTFANGLSKSILDKDAEWNIDHGKKHRHQSQEHERGFDRRGTTLRSRSRRYVAFAQRVGYAGLQAPFATRESAVCGHSIFYRTLFPNPIGRTRSDRSVKFRGQNSRLS